ncbi:hypothetical protein AFLA_005993 [Aspergillus flavus NRRL3357]|nr:hypothetical protein AFLA_005993 [Aspergillus flavus NRRL3357]
MAPITLDISVPIPSGLDRKVDNTSLHLTRFATPAARQPPSQSFPETTNMLTIFLSVSELGRQYILQKRG